MPDCSELGRELVLAYKEGDRLRAIITNLEREIADLEDALRSEQDYADMALEDCE